MTVSVREAGPFERVVGFELTNAEIDAAKTTAARRMAKDLSLKGFRPGKAPRPVIEAAVGADRLRSEAIEEAIPPKLTKVLTDEDLAPIVDPELSNVEDIEGGVAVEVKITLWPKLDTVPNYRDRKIEIESPEVTDDDVEQQLNRMREQFGQVEEVERTASEGDFVSVDVSATVNGQELAEAAATELLYRLGSGGLLEGADEALEGAAAGDVLTLMSPLPEGMGEDAGTEAEFSITVNEVKELLLPDLDNDWVDENTEFDTVEDLRGNLRERMEEMKRSTLARRFADRVLDTLVDQVEIELPQAIVKSEMDDILHRFVHRLEEQQISLEDYFAATGISSEQFLGDLSSQAERSLRTRLVLDAVIEDAGIALEESEVDKVLHSIAGQSDDPLGFLKAVRGTPQELSLRGDMLRDKAIEMILENATAVDPDGNEIALDLGPTSGDIVEDEVLEGEVVMGEVVEGEVVEGEVVEGEVVPGDQVEDEFSRAEVVESTEENER
jgi:trigger factor